MEERKPISITSLITIPALITLGVTILRLVGELEHWPKPWFSAAAGGGGARVIKAGIVIRLVMEIGFLSSIRTSFCCRFRL